MSQSMELLFLNEGCSLCRLVVILVISVTEEEEEEKAQPFQWIGAPNMFTDCVQLESQVVPGWWSSASVPTAP